MSLRSSSINVTALHKFANDIGGEDPNFLIELIDSYLDNTQSLPQDLYTSFAEQDFELILRTAHALKSSSSVIGAEDMTELRRELETSVRGKNYENLDIKINEIADEDANVKSDLENEKCS